MHVVNDSRGQSAGECPKLSIDRKGAAAETLGQEWERTDGLSGSPIHVR